MLAIENGRVEQNGLDLAKELLRQNQSRFNVGSLPRTAVLESEAEVARREADLVTATALQRVARDNLRALVNARQNDGDALIMIEPADKPMVSKTDFNLDESLRVGYEQRELLAARFNVDGRQVERKMPRTAAARPIWWPDRPQRPRRHRRRTANAGVTLTPPPAPSLLPDPCWACSLGLLTDSRYYRYLVGGPVALIDNASAKADCAQAKINAGRPSRPASDRRTSPWRSPRR